MPRRRCAVESLAELLAGNPLECSVLVCVAADRRWRVEFALLRSPYAALPLNVAGTPRQRQGMHARV